MIAHKARKEPDLVRRSFEPGHTRKLLVVADESPEFCPALLYAATRVARIGGALKMLQVIEPPDDTYWLSVKSTHAAERERRARAIFRRARSFLRTEGLGQVSVENKISNGEIHRSIAFEIGSDPDIALLVLGAAHDQAGPGRIVSYLTEGSRAAKFLVPILIVPGSLTPAEIRALA